MFQPDLCDQCGKCLGSCQYLDFDEAAGAAAMEKLINGEDSPWVNLCITCFACNEICPNHANPFDLICAKMEETGTYIDPAMVEMMAAHFIPQGEFKAPRVSGRALSLCTIGGMLDQNTLDGPLFAGLPRLKGRFFFCNVLFPHMGNMSLLTDHLEAIVGRLAATGANEIVFAHDDCFAMIQAAREAGIEIPFKAMHLYEHLLEYLKEHKGQVKNLGLKVAFQRPCASRATPEKEPMLDEIFDRIGVTRVAREFDREKALCCGQNTADAIAARAGQAVFQDKNVADAKAHDAKAMVFLCPMCLGAMGEKVKEAGMETIMIADLVDRALKTD